MNKQTRQQMKKIIWAWQPDKVIEVNDKTAELLCKSKYYTLVQDSELVEIKEEPKKEQAEETPKPKRRRTRRKNTEANND